MVKLATSGESGKRAPSSHAPASATARKVIEAFNTWAFKREQPSDMDLLRQVVSRAIERNASLPFVLYWGKGPRSTIATPDTECLDFLAALDQRVRRVHLPGALITLVFTDTHAQLNGHAGADIRRYFTAVAEAAAQRGFESCWLSTLKSALDPTQRQNTQTQLHPDTLEKLARCAERWYAGNGTATEGARQYYEMNMVEKRAVEHAFPDAIFITFNGRTYRDLFPERMPIFYMYSLRRGVAVKPWFMADETAPSRAPRETEASGLAPQ